MFAGTPAAPRPETTTYIDGNLTGVTPQTGGTLVFTNEKALQFRTGLATFDVPYSSITKAELGAKQTHSRKTPAYKVWALPKRMGSSTQTQILLLEFKGDEGDAKSMTLELASSSVNNVVATINSHRSPSEGPVATASAAAPAGSSKASKNSTKTASAKTRKPSRAERKKEAELASARPAEGAASKAAAKPEWWGDAYWKTSRNTGTWKQAETVAAGSAKPATDKPSPTQQ
ncbi:MAG TPA: hypothetical protein VGP79_07465 [Bryobacteraceae bacterium]|nr:hypothetical protein [Bryobacteraceae bacterium]